MPFARASELDRLLACPGSLILPRGEKSEAARTAAEWGTLAHAWMETGVIPDSRGGTTLRKKIEQGGVKRDELWFEGLYEVSLAYNVISGDAKALVLPVSRDKREHWKGAFGEEWITGTADFVGELLGAPWVDDLKTGRYVSYEDYRYQQAFYSMVWALFYTKELIPVRSTVTHWPKYPLDIKPSRLGAVLEPDFFRDFQVKLKNLREDVMRAKDKVARGGVLSGELSDGPQCRYCPSKLACVKGSKYV